MQNFISSIVSTCIVALLLYLMGSFISLSFDISEWHILVRILVGIMFIYALAIISARTGN